MTASYNISFLGWVLPNKLRAKKVKKVTAHPGTIITWSR